VRIGLCTDTHYWPQSGNLMGGEGNIQLVGESDRLLTQLTAELAVADLDLVLHLGDFTCGGGYFQMPLPDFYAAVDATHDALTQLDAHPIRNSSYRRNRAGYSLDNFACIACLLRTGRILLRLLVSFRPSSLKVADEACVPLDGTPNIEYDR
jgi:hypothetical protein